MEEGAKRRLVGAAVIVALMVIFVPMLVEEGGESPVPESALEVPPRPAVEPGPVQHPTAELQPDEVVAEPPDAPAELQPPPLYIPPETDADTMAEEDVWTPTPVLVPEAAPEEPEAASAEEPAPKPSPEPPVAVRTPAPEARPAPAPAPSPSGPGSWVVQVAALSEQPRAKALEQQLQDQGFPAFIESVRIDGRLFHRVRIGPEADKGRAERLAATLRDQGHAAQIQRYP